MKRLLLCAVLVVGMAGPAGAVRIFKTGNNLLAVCQDDAKQLVCYGYVQGIADTLGANPIAGWRACLATNVTVGQVTDIVVAWLKANPQARHLAAHSLVAQALEEAFPCKK